MGHSRFRFVHVYKTPVRRYVLPYPVLHRIGKNRDRIVHGVISAVKFVKN
jgi:hypothetical protein